jgi:adenylate kinase
MSRHFIGGLNGVGKSTVISSISGLNPVYQRLHTTSLFMEHLGIPPGDYDQLRALPDDFKVQENNRMLDSLSATPTAPGCGHILDSHFLNIVEGRATRLIEGTWPRRLGSLVLVTSDVQVIYDRLMADAPTRERRLFTLNTTPGQQRDAISHYLAMTVAEFEYVADLAGCPSIIIDNNSTPEVAAEEFLGFAAGLNCSLISETSVLGE